MKKLFSLSILLACAFFFVSCSETKQQENENLAKLKIVCTTSIIADVVQNICPEDVEVVSLMGYGVDPHIYKPTQGDLESLQSADVIIYNGVHLEGRMVDILNKMRRTKIVLAMEEGFDPAMLINNSDFIDGQDPHIWFDIEMWSLSIQYIAQTLAQIDTANSEEYINRAKPYLESLFKLDSQIAFNLQEIEPKNRFIVTSHDALNYYARRYGFEVMSLQGSSTAAEFGIKDVSKLVNFIVQNELRSVFAENVVSPQALEAVISGCEEQGHTVAIGGKLYSDALGPKGSAGDTYLKMIEENTNVLISGLR